jgi:hypothetical protein
MIEMIRLARLVMNIRDGVCDALDYDTVIAILSEFLSITEADVDSYMNDHEQEIVEWQP